MPGDWLAPIPKPAVFLYNRLMVWVRKGAIHVLALVLLVSLLGLAFSASARLNLTHPGKLEGWLKQSGFYTSFVNDRLHSAQQSASNDQGAGRVSLSDPEVTQAVHEVFSAQFLEPYVNTFLTSNYAWLEGKTATPAFKIDLTGAKQKLADQIGQTVQTRVAGLPVCSDAQLAQLQSTLQTDPLAIPCRPPTLTAQTAATQVVAQISGSSDFLSNPVLTAGTLNPNKGQQGQPYYQKLSQLPKFYRLSLKLPWIFGILAVLSAVGILFISFSRRRGLRRIGWMLLVAGVLLVAVKLVSDTIFNHLQNKVFSNSNLGQLQHALTDFLHRIEAQLVKTDLWFGIAFLVLAALILGTLWFRRERPQKRPSSDQGGRLPPESTTDTAAGERPPLPTLKPPARPKRPRLIQ